MHQPRVLLAEDDASLRALYKEIFIHNNFAVSEAEDGQIAIDMAVTDRPDAIVLDLMMPRQGGLAALRIFRTLPETKDLPIFILTALPNPDYQKMAEGRVQGYFLKTETKPQELVEKVRAFLTER